VCRYDDYDAECEPESHTQIVTEMAAARKAAAPAPSGYRTDDAHSQRHAHSPAKQEMPAAASSKRDFGAGIF
jgi:hypothetical protein